MFRNWISFVIVI